MVKVLRNGVQELTVQGHSVRVMSLNHSRSLLSGDTEGLHESLFKTKQKGESQQGVFAGAKPHPFNFARACDIKNFNTHHSTCIEAKAASTVGLGFTDDSISKALDSLCEMDFLETLNQVGLDFWNTGNGWLEVVRAAPRQSARITGLHHVPSRGVRVVVEDASYDKHCTVWGEGGSSTKRFAMFGDLDDLRSRFSIKSNSKTTELIHFRRTSSTSRWYGDADWISAVAPIELMMSMTQQQFDFFNNRAVPEFLLMITGGQISDADWAVLNKTLKAHVGEGNQFKSAVINLPNPNLKAELHKLSLDTDAGTMYQVISNELALQIVTAHGVPPLLAGIQIPGKLGAHNELPNAIMGFQVLKIGPAQRIFEARLAATLGNSKLNAGLGVPGKKFKLKKATDDLNLQAMATAGSMKQTVPEAQAQGRNLNAGLKKRGRGRTT